MEMKPESKKRPNADELLLSSATKNNNKNVASPT